MADVFISYAHEDIAAAQALEAKLQAAKWLVWRDVRLKDGSLTKQVTDALDASRCVVVLWSSASIASNWVGGEALRAFDDDRLLQVKLENVVPEVPFNSQVAFDLTTFDPKASDDSHPELAKLLAAVARRLGRSTPDAYERLERLLRWLREARYVGKRGAVMALLLLTLQATGWVDSLLGIDTRFRYLSLQARSVFVPRPLHDALRVVVFDEKTARHVPSGHSTKLGDDVSQHREFHAKLLDRLVVLRPAVVTFDISFGPDEPGKPKPRGTEELAAAIARAQQQGVKVVLAARYFADDGTPVLHPLIRAALTPEGSVASRGRPFETVGQPCIGRLREGVAGVVALVIDIGSPREPLLLPSLALATMGQYLGRPKVMRGDDGSVSLSDGRASGRIDFVDWERIHSSSERTCDAMKDKSVEAARRILDPLPFVLSRERPEVIPYERVLEGAPADVRGKIVLVGVGLRDDARWRALRRLGLAEQHGYALHADAIDTLLRGRFLRGIGAPLQLAWLVLFAGAGMAVGRFIPTHRERARQLALGGLVVVDAVIVALVAVNLGVLMDALYSMLAVFAGYVFVKR